MFYYVFIFINIRAALFLCASSHVASLMLLIMTMTKQYAKLFAISLHSALSKVLEQYTDRQNCTSGLNRLPKHIVNDKYDLHDVRFSKRSNWCVGEFSSEGAVLGPPTSIYLQIVC